MRLEWKHRFLTTGLPGKSVHSIVKNICFQKKKKRQGRETGKKEDRRQETGEGDVSLLCFSCKQEPPGFGFFLIQKNSFHPVTFW